MSVRIMSRIWSHSPHSSDRLLVLLALADWANDEGECWPSMEQLARKARITDRGARGIVRELEESGHLKTLIGGGRGNRSRYQLITEPGSSFSENQERGDTETRNVEADKPGTARQRNKEEPSLYPPVEQPPKAPHPEWLPLESWKDYKVMRVSIRKPMTPRAEKLALGKLAELREQGYDPKTILDESVFNSWQGLFPPKNGNSNGKSKTENIRSVIARVCAEPD